MKWIVYILFCVSTINVEAKNKLQSLVEAVTHINDNSLPISHVKVSCLAVQQSQAIHFLEHEGKNFCADPYNYVCNWKSQKILTANADSYLDSDELQQKIKNIFSQKNVEKFKRQYRKVVLESELPAKLKTLYLRRIDALKIYAGQQIENGQISLIRDQLCGPANDVVNAAAFPLMRFDGDKFVPRNNVEGAMVVCPAIVKQLVNKNDNEITAWKKLSFVLGHELGHILYGRDLFDKGGMDAGEGYRCWKECIAYNDSQRWLLKSENEKPREYHWYNFFSRFSRVNDRLAELGADYWGLEVFSSELAKNDMNTPKMVKQAFGILCGSSDEGTHPHAQYRIAITLRNHPKLMKIFKCKNNYPPEDKSCRLTPDNECQVDDPFEDDF